MGEAVGKRMKQGFAAAYAASGESAISIGSTLWGATLQRDIRQ
jgi:hypothetical protein